MSYMDSDSIDIGQATAEVVAGVIHGDVHIHKPTTDAIDATPEEREAFALFREASTDHWMGDLVAALRKYDAFLAAYERSHNLHVQGWVAWASFNKGSALQALNRLREACAAFSELLTRSRGRTEDDIRQAVASGLHQWIVISVKLKDYQSAVGLANLLDHEYGRDRDPDRMPEIAVGLVFRAIALSKMGQYGPSAVDAHATFDRLGRIGDPAVEGLRARAKLIAGNSHAAMGDNQQAAAAYAAVVASYGNSPDPDLRSVAQQASQALTKIAPRKENWTRHLRR
jgi:tetratricopeptide (TPR) repeat protein